MSDTTVVRLIDTKSHVAHSLAGRIVTIGSAADCHITISGGKAAQRAAHLIFSHGGYTIQPIALGARITVNGTAIDAEGCRLKHGDMVSVEGATFEYRDRNDAAVTPPQAAQPQALSDIIGVVVSLLRNRDKDVSEELVASVSRLLRSDGARLVAEQDGDSGERNTIARYPRSAGLERFSSRAIEWAREARQTVLMHENDWRDAADTINSLAKNRIASVLCAPLREGDSVLGYLYLDRLQTSEPFTESDRAFCDTLTPLFAEILANAAERRRQRDTIARLQENRPLTAAGGMIYASDIMAKIVSQARTLAPADSPMLVLGETGTGKELMARFIHDNSTRAAKPFKAINCGAIPETLIESELFGHEKGAFTGASQRKIGLFEAANGGTVFLDEIGELPQLLQVKLLRVLQESEFTRVGGTETIHVDVRIIAATNRVLEDEVSSGRFRQDLFFRLNVLSIRLPPLRERGQDIELLAGYFMKKYCDQFGLPLKTLSSEARGVLVSYAWPGNIRELENIIQKSILLSTSNTIRGSDVQLPAANLFGRQGGDIITTLRDARAWAEKNVITQALTRTSGNISMSAKILDIDRKWLMKKMEELGIDADTFRG